MTNALPRRNFLKGLGALVALPYMESLAPVRGASAAGAGVPPVRMGFIFVPNGVNLEHWTPTREGADFDLPSILEPLSAHRRDLLVLSGLTHDKGRANGDGPGDHARSAGVFLTGQQPLKSEGAAIRAGVSVDQYAAAKIGAQTRFASLELGTERGRQSGKCDSGYSCAYSNNISWRDEATPMTKETNPRLVFERLFGPASERQQLENYQRRARLRKSVLDFVLEDARRLEKRAAASDRMKLDQYLTAVREIERRVERAEGQNAQGSLVAAGYEMPDAEPESYEDHIRLMGDMMVLAFQADLTRVCTFMFANAGSNKSYSFIGVSDGHHSLSHHQGNAEKLDRIRRINRFHVDQLAYILDRLKSIPEGDGNLLDHSMIVYGSGISDGNRHNNENLPILLAGQGGGTIATGRHIRYPEETPMCNLFVSMLDRVGADPGIFGDSTGPLRYLEG